MNKLSQVDKHSLANLFGALHFIFNKINELI
jgi:hypothetical protein